MSEQDIQIQPVIASITFYYQKESIQNYLENCAEWEKTPSQQGFEQWVDDDLNSKRDTLWQWIEIAPDPEESPIPVKLASSSA